MIFPPRQHSLALIHRQLFESFDFVKVNRVLSHFIFSCFNTQSCPTSSVKCTFLVSLNSFTTFLQIKNNKITSDNFTLIFLMLILLHKSQTTFGKALELCFDCKITSSRIIKAVSFADDIVGGRKLCYRGHIC